MGTETEYGVLAPSQPGANATVLSSQIINAYAATMREGYGNLAGTRWDYTDEHPLQDARGWEMSRSEAHASQLTDEAPVLDAEQVALAGTDFSSGFETGPEDDVLMNMVLGNGARLYVDHAHPEYSSPEVTNPRDAVLWDKAGDVVVQRAMERVAATPGFAPVNLYKNNTDSKSVSYGSHENYLMPRSVPFARITSGLLPFFASRQVTCGAGRVGIGALSQESGYQISQRADFFEASVGLETTVRRPIINTRDEPHAVADKYRRLHVIIGDANLSEVSCYLKVGTAALVLDMIEAGTVPELELDSPVEALQTISHDPSLRATVRTTDGRSLTGVDLQEIYFEAAQAHVGDSPDEQTQDVLARWGSLIDVLRRSPMDAAPDVDWIAKLKLLQAFRDRDNLEWSDARLALVDLQYADMRPTKGLYYRLAARGQMTRLLTDDEIEAAVRQPPSDTRAYFRGNCVSRYSANVASASWDSIVFELPGRRRLQRIQTLEPCRGTRTLTEHLFEAADDVEHFVALLLGDTPG